MVKLAKRLKKEKVNVDVINFGEEVSLSENWMLSSPQYGASFLMLSPWSPGSQHWQIVFICEYY